ncbi:GNAT family N-acetyltransferase [Duganella radicis]|uniref:Uncharacterized protein n=1 Tax=Duganella radicis TaxID=551988 RepID=A0A6L6PCC8_9BURK|nr:GNAT family N-acetyltransferase [Duganella radicis]MTV36309.1 hypothetical protein [Duganella radicis]
MQTRLTNRSTSGGDRRGAGKPRLGAQPGETPAGAVADERVASLTQRQLQQMASHSVQVGQLKARADMMDGRHAGSLKETSSTAQLKPVLGRVSWGVTHAVKEVNGSIYGNGTYEEGEIGPWGELKLGDIVTVDDADLFMSRRGANQEIDEIRIADGRGQPRVEWIRVLRIKGVDVTALNVFVRRATVEIGEHIEDPESQWAKVTVRDVHWDDAAMLKGVARIGREYEEATAGRIPEKGRNICSTAEMNQDDEGAEVARELPKYRDLTGDGVDHRTRVAEVQGNTLIGVMQITVREEERTQFLYIKWLLGSRSVSGGGVALVRSALEYAIRKHIMAVKVESAMSAVSWYQKRGFSKTGNAQHMNDAGEDPLPTGETEETIDCGCAEMELQFRWGRE